MLIKGCGKTTGGEPACPVCGKELAGLGSSLEVCPDCIRSRWEDCSERVKAIHAGSRRIFGLPSHPPRSASGTSCDLCFNSCGMGSEEKGYCGVRNGNEMDSGREGRSLALLSYYYDPIPTNCVADWVCPAGSGAGYPKYANDRCTEVGYYNLAVFFEACNFNCLYCQNWYYKKVQFTKKARVSTDALVKAVNSKTSCICYFGGDPTPQLPFALKAAEKARAENPDRILRVCWETNGSAAPAWLERMARISFDSGGIVKVDLKAWDSGIHRALCGCDNRRVIENFSRLAQWIPRRPDPPFLVASTVMVPGYVDEREVFDIASFIARLNPDIPYALLAFAPQFFMEDFPCTSRSQADACLEAAKRAGLNRVRIGNQHLIS